MTNNVLALRRYFKILGLTEQLNRNAVRRLRRMLSGRLNTTSCGIRQAFLIMYVGPRVEEVFNLNVTDIELKEKSGSLHIRKGKGIKEMISIRAMQNIIAE